MDFEKAVKRLEEHYKRAKSLGWVHNPLAYALYQVWKEADRGKEKQPETEECGFCQAKIYIKIVQNTAPLVAPITEAQALRDKLVDLTGEVYAEITKKFCPVCGRQMFD